MGISLFSGFIVAVLISLAFLILYGVYKEFLKWFDK